jgi:hypothetical protein
MERARRRLAIIAPIVAVLFGTAVAASRPVEPSRLASAYAEAGSWVKANSATLPSSYEEIVRLPMLHRKAVVHELSLSQQKQVWREHLESFVLPDSRLSAAQRLVASQMKVPLDSYQRAFVQSAIDSLDHIFSAKLTVEQRQAKSLPFCSKKQTVFAGDVAGAIFARLGPADSAYDAMRREQGMRLSEAGLVLQLRIMGGGFGNGFGAPPLGAVVASETAR